MMRHRGRSTKKNKLRKFMIFLILVFVWMVSYYYIQLPNSIETTTINN